MDAPIRSMEQLIDKIRRLPSERIAELEDFVVFLYERTKSRFATRESFDFPIIRAGQWPQDLKLRREDMYDDDGR